MNSKKQREIESALASLAEKHPDRIEAMKDEAERKRREHELYWLEQERLRYGVTKQAKPISRMIV